MAAVWLVSKLCSVGVILMKMCRCLTILCVLEDLICLGIPLPARLIEGPDASEHGISVSSGTLLHVPPIFFSFTMLAYFRGRRRGDVHR